MNRNIEVINENLWAVSFDYVKMGFIKELNFRVTNATDYATLTADGKIILNNNKPVYSKVLKVLNFIMKLSDKQLCTEKSFHAFIKKIYPKTSRFTTKEMNEFIKAMKLESVKLLFMNLSSIENERRRCKKLFGIKNKPNRKQLIKKR